MSQSDLTKNFTANAGSFKERISRYLTLDFDGYFMCRVATDPDPSDDPYGTSGYTMALSNEPVLDQVIRLQPDPSLAPLRSNPLEHIQVGVSVRNVSFDGSPDPARTEILRGARVELMGNPKFISTNNAVGSDDNMAFLIEPFHLSIQHKLQIDDKPVSIAIDAVDYLDPCQKDKTAAQIANPALYAYRLSSQASASIDAHRAIEVFDEYGYFRDRRYWLKERIEKTTDEQERQACRSRLYQIETWGDRMSNKLGFRSIWAHETNGEQRFHIQSPGMANSILNGQAILDQPWYVKYWFGGWDGDLLIGFMVGSLNIPFVPNDFDRSNLK
jgi:hypothetical protein